MLKDQLIKHRKIIGLIVLFISILLSPLFCCRLYVWGIDVGNFQQIQQKLDEQCGHGVIKADWEGYYSDIPADPIWGWFGDDASCHYSGLMLPATVVCHCPEPTSTAELTRSSGGA